MIAVSVYYFFGALLVWLSIRSLRNGLEYRSYAVSSLAGSSTGYSLPFASVIAPSRGIEQRSEQNIAALFSQNYPRYELLFVLDSEDDPIAAVIKDAIARLSTENVCARLLIAPQAVDSSQKIENLRHAAVHIDASAGVLAFVDSDVEVSPDWLASLAAGLEGKDVGAATGYRWYASERGNFASELRSVWNASIATALGPNAKTNFCWGGSMAISREIFDRLDIRGAWRGTLSDDFAVTRRVKDAGLGIRFVPRAIGVSIDDCSFAELLEFTTRQMKITRVYAPALWVTSLIGSAIFCGVIAASILILVFGEPGLIRFWAAAGILIMVTALSAAKGWVRLEAIRIAVPEFDDRLRRQRWAQCTLFGVSTAVFLYNSIAALFSRRIRWRGTAYLLKSPRETVIIPK